MQKYTGVYTKKNKLLMFGLIAAFFVPSIIVIALATLTQIEFKAWMSIIIVGSFLGFFFLYIKILSKNKEFEIYIKNDKFLGIIVKGETKSFYLSNVQIKYFRWGYSTTMPLGTICELTSGDFKIKIAGNQIDVSKFTNQPVATSAKYDAVFKGEDFEKLFLYINSLKQINTESKEIENHHEIEIVKIQNSSVYIFYVFLIMGIVGAVSFALAQLQFKSGFSQIYIIAAVLGVFAILVTLLSVKSARNSKQKTLKISVRDGIFVVRNQLTTIISCPLSEVKFKFHHHKSKSRLIGASFTIISPGNQINIGLNTVGDKYYWKEKNNLKMSIQYGVMESNFAELLKMLGIYEKLN